MVTSLFADEPPGASPSYTAMRSGANPVAIEAREHCENLWRDYAPLADCNFRSQFTMHTHERWFEMYLTVALLRAGLDVRCPKPGPDVLLTVDDRRVWIEATCATAGAPGLPDSVPERPIPKAGEAPVVTSVPTDAITLRLRNSLHEKEQKIQGYIANGIVATGDVTAVAINVFAVPDAWPDLDDQMRRMLYGLGHLTLSINVDTKAIVGSSYQERPSIEKKSTSAPVSVAPFASGSMPHVSAVIGSREDAANRPPRLGDGFSVYPNIGATNPWPAGAIPLGQEWLVTHVQNGADLGRLSYIPSTK